MKNLICCLGLASVCALLGCGGGESASQIEEDKAKMEEMQVSPDYQKYTSAGRGAPEAPTAGGTGEGASDAKAPQ